LAAYKSDELVEMLLTAIDAGHLKARIVTNMRINEPNELKKVFRIACFNGKEFVLDRNRPKYCQIWSKDKPNDLTKLEGEPEYYPADRSRHSNLGVMKTLCGPSKSGSRQGSAAFVSKFHKPVDAFKFIFDISES